MHLLVTFLQLTVILCMFVSSFNYVSSLTAGCTTGKKRFDSMQVLKMFPLSTAMALPLGFGQPPVQWLPCSFIKVKWPGREADHSPLSRVEAKNLWSCTCISPHLFMICFIKHYLTHGAGRVSTALRRPSHIRQKQTSFKQICACARVRCLTTLSRNKFAQHRY